jgi:hypothetical protein
MLARLMENVVIFQIENLFYYVHCAQGHYNYHI